MVLISLFQILSILLLINVFVIIFISIFKFLKSNNQIDTEINKLKDKE
ncbi:hypothetical protein UT300012_37740 [Paraclostridium bifermentans]|jgi:hypothetical protein|nr:hypothetical protein C671_2927 [[Clostridium] bifermentans ATCC 19299] [Paraclostridium bifermentans ATCC 19299]GIM33234.1 hypothetical protein PAGU1678_25030 [Paraclostridium bifermentans subsp. muricolitidis]